MNLSRIEQIANAALYEGYLLYPYRSSAMKNRLRFNFGVVYPRRFCALQSGTELSEMRSECLLAGDTASVIDVKVRFLQLMERDGRQEGLEREVVVPSVPVESIVASTNAHRFTFAAPEPIEGTIEFQSLELEANLFKVTLTIRNDVELPSESDMSREKILLRSFVSVHSILRVTGGQFVSLIDPPDDYRAAVSCCVNSSAWPVMVGDEGSKDAILCSPIILYDYPQIAQESPGDLFDGTEIDEILTLRILTMTDAEKLEVRNGDDRGRKILERTELLPPEHFQKLHGALRGLTRRPEASQ